MSLSEAPSIKITTSTSRDISDELLGGTISFCEEVGYKQNIMVITFLWSGFLLSCKSQLDENGLVEKVLNCYVQSLCNLFSKVRGDESLKKQVSEMLQHYWNNLNLDFDDMKSEEEISKFLQIANKLNSQDDTSSTYLLNKDPCDPFGKIASILNSNIYRILHQIDNGMTIRYRGIVQYPFLNQQANNARTTSQTHTTPVTKSKVIPQAKKSSFPLGLIFTGILILVFIVSAIYAFSNDNSPSSTKPTYQETTLAVIQEPRSGEILLGQEDFYGSELTITASGGSSCVVKLKTSSGTTRLSFFVRAGDTVTVGVPDEYLYVYFASGDTWYGEKHLFGSDTSYSMDDEIKDFTQYTWKYTLYPVTNGNFSETPIDPEDF